MQTIWLSPTDFVSGDPSLQISYPFVSHPSTIVMCKTPGDLKWVSMALRLPTDVRIEEVRVCYQISSQSPAAPPESFISQVRLVEMTTPDQAIVRHDDPTDLKSTTPECFIINVGGLVLKAALTLALRLSFHNTQDRIILGAVGVKFEPALGIDSWSLVGNASTNPPTNFLGTTDDQSLVIKTNGVEAMRVNTDGKVGIGTFNPSDELHVKETLRATIARFEGNGQGSIVFFDGAATDRGRMGFGSAGHIFSEALPNSFAIRSEAALHLGVSSSVVMTLREICYPRGSGYIGIGTTQPTAILTIAGEDSPRIHITSNSPGPNPSRTWGLISFTDGTFNITDITASIDRLIITPDGNIRIMGNLEIINGGVFGAGTAPKMISAKDFAPPTLRANFGTLSGTAPAPYLLTTAYGSLAAAQADFPLSATSGDLILGTFNTNSLDWAVLQEALLYAEAHYNATLWLDHGAYGIIGKIKVRGGVMIAGQGSQGSSNTTGTGITHFDTGDLFEWDGTSDPFGTGGFVGTGGGLKNITIFKANRVPFGGLSYQGGRALYVHAPSTAHRPGEMRFDTTLIASEGSSTATKTITDAANVTPIVITTSTAHGYFTGYRPTIAGVGGNAAANGTRTITVLSATTFSIDGSVGNGDYTSGGTSSIPAATWEHGLYVDGSTLRTNGAAGIRTIHGDKLRVACTTTASQSIFLRYVEHVAMVGASLDDGAGSGTGITIEGDCNQISFVGLKCMGAVVVKPTDTTAITGATNANPIVITSTGHGFPIGQTPNVFIEDVLGNAAANGAFLATIIDANTLSIPIAGNGGYTSGGTLRSTSPRDVSLHGRAAVLSVTGTDSTGTATLSGGQDPTVGPSIATWINKSKNFRCVGPYTPEFWLEKTSESANVTGDGTQHTVTFDVATRNSNKDDFGTSGGPAPFPAYVVTSAGTYQFWANVLLHGVFATVHTRIDVVIDVNAVPVASVVMGPSSSLGANAYMSVSLSTPPLSLAASDAVRVKVTVYGITISNATNATPIVVTTNTPSYLTTGATPTISGCTGNTAANGTNAITVIDATSFSIDGSTGNGTYTGGGQLGVKDVKIYGDGGSHFTSFSGRLV